jgi:hypothetical protein
MRLPRVAGVCLDIGPDEGLVGDALDDRWRLDALE